MSIFHRFGVAAVLALCAIARLPGRVDEPSHVDITWMSISNV